MWTGEIEGVLVDATDQLAIIRDDEGIEHAERWGVVQVQASGPAQTCLPLYKDAPAPREPGLMQISEEQQDQLNSDPYRRAALRAMDLLAFVDHLQVEVESLENDHNRASDLLSEIQMLLSDIADNRARRIIEEPRSHNAEAQARYDSPIESAFQHAKAEAERDAAEAAANESEASE